MYTKELINKAKEMRLNRSTYDFIGKSLGVTRQTAWLWVNKDFKGPSIKIPSEYPNIMKWMRENYISTGTLCKLLGIELKTLYRKLNNKSSFKLDEILKILDFTGLTFEEAFRTTNINNDNIIENNLNTERN